MLDLEGIRRVLDHSPILYAADPDLKRRGMSHFQPNALTISRGAEWEERRQFNEAVLATVQCGPIPGMGSIRSFVQADHPGDHLRPWARGDTALTDRLTAMMRESNRVFFLGKARKFDVFYERIRHHRDWETDPDIGNFRPEFWLDKPVDYRFNHLSRGNQVCAGKNLALFVAKAVIANLLVRGRYRLHKPKLNSGKPLPFQYDDFATRFEYFRPFQAP